MTDSAPTPMTIEKALKLLSGAPKESEYLAWAVPLEGECRRTEAWSRRYVEGFRDGYSSLLTSNEKLVKERDELREAIGRLLDLVKAANERQMMISANAFVFGDLEKLLSRPPKESK